jgi:hypothetical protein
LGALLTQGCMNSALPWRWLSIADKSSLNFVC